MWDGNEKVCVDKALQEADITPKEFYACWRDKVKSLSKTERGKKQIASLLKKAGFRDRHGNNKTRLRQTIAFVKEVVGRDTSKPAPATINSPSAQVCT